MPAHASKRSFVRGAEEFIRCCRDAGMTVVSSATKTNTRMTNERDGTSGSRARLDAAHRCFERDAA